METFEKIELTSKILQKVIDLTKREKELFVAYLEYAQRFNTTEITNCNLKMLKKISLSYHLKDTSNLSKEKRSLANKGFIEKKGKKYFIKNL